MRWTVIVECAGAGGSTSTVRLGTIERPVQGTAADSVGLNLEESKEISRLLQATVVTQQLEEYCQARRRCPTCGTARPLKDHRQRLLDTVLGRISVFAPRYCGCRRCSETSLTSPVSELLPDRATPELRHLQVSLGAQMPYRQAASILREFLPPCGGANHATTRNRVLGVAERIERDLAQDVAAAKMPDHPESKMVVALDGAFIKGRRPGAPGSIEIVMGRIETGSGTSKAFAVVRDHDGQAKQVVRALLRRNGRGPETKVRVLCDGEEGMRAMVGRWFNGSEEHVLDWYHVARQIDAIGKTFLYLPHIEDFGVWLGRHWRDLSRVRWKLWDGNPYGASVALSFLWDGVFIHAVQAGEGQEQAELVRERIDRLWRYLCANERRLINYGEEYRRGRRVSTAHVESLVNQLANWRMAKKQQMRWTVHGAQMLLHVRCSMLNGELARYTGWSGPLAPCAAAAAA
jgi:hypothetical protein